MKKQKDILERLVISGFITNNYTHNLNIYEKNQIKRSRTNKNN